MRNLFVDISKYIQLIKLTDILDIIIVAILIYQLLKMIRETRALQLVKGIAILFVLLQASAWMNLTALNYILRNVMQVGLFSVVVIFQPELRSFLDRMGRSRFGKLIDFTSSEELSGIEKTVNEIVNACVNLSASKTGALIVLERDTKLGDIIKSGTVLDAEISSSLIENIFFPNTPLHDGAVIIRDEKIHTAGCLLPLSFNTHLSKELGTRHRAALGMSEVSDSLIIVVSEETGQISIAVNGSFTRNLNGDTLQKALLRAMDNNSSGEFDKIKFWKGAQQK